MTVERIRNISHVLIIAGFLLAIYLPLMDNLFGIDRSEKVHENRSLAQMPSLKFQPDSLAEFPDRFEEYYNDRFGFRDSMVRLNHRIHLSLFETSPVEKVILGKDNWLFYRPYVEYSRRNELLSDAELNRWKKVLERQRDWLEERNIPFLVVFAPVKTRIYHEFIGEAYRSFHNPSILDQTLEYLKSNSDLEVVDLRPVLKEAKNEVEVYERTGTHWTYFGTWYAYREILRALNQWFPSMEPVPIPSEKPLNKPIATGDLVRLLQARSMPRFCLSHLHNFKHKLTAEEKKNVRPRRGTMGRSNFAMVTDKKELPRAVVFRDSFSTKLVPFLSEHFERVVYVWDRRIYPALILNEKPDVVVFEMLEYYLRLPPPIDWRLTSGPEIEKRFLNSRQTVLCLSAKSRFSRIRAARDTSIQTGGEILEIHNDKSKPAILLPPFPLTNKLNQIIEIDIESPVRTTMILNGILADKKGEARNQRISRGIRKGRNRYYVLLDFPEPADRIQLVFSKPGVTYKIHRIEVRTVDS